MTLFTQKRYTILAVALAIFMSFGWYNAGEKFDNYRSLTTLNTQIVAAQHSLDTAELRYALEQMERKNVQTSDIVSAQEVKLAAQKAELATAKKRLSDARAALLVAAQALRDASKKQVRVAKN